MNRDTATHHFKDEEIYGDDEAHSDGLSESLLKNRKRVVMITGERTDVSKR
jgi:hypothetical protein